MIIGTTQITSALEKYLRGVNERGISDKILLRPLQSAGHVSLSAMALSDMSVKERVSRAFGTRDAHFIHVCSFLSSSEVLKALATEDGRQQIVIQRAFKKIDRSIKHWNQNSKETKDVIETLSLTTLFSEAIKRKTQSSKQPDTLIISSLNINNFKNYLALVKTKQKVKTVIISSISVSQKEFLLFLKSCPELTFLALTSEKKYVEAQVKDPSLFVGKWLFVDRDTFSNYDVYVTPLLDSQVFDQCVFVDYSWHAYTEPMRRELEKKYPRLRTEHLQLPLPDGCGMYLKSIRTVVKR